MSLDQLTYLLLMLLAELVFSDAKLNSVTCGSVLKLLNIKYDVRLHSHDVKYGSGSGQQSVTAVSDSDDSNSYWSLMGTLDTPCTRGTPVKCGDTVRLMHLNTHCLLHSHLFPSPLSNNQEVSCFGKDAVGDTGDYWVIQCDTEVWRRDGEVKLKHRDTNFYLGTSGHKYGRPISGQHEIVAFESPSASIRWKTAEGIYVETSRS